MKIFFILCVSLFSAGAFAANNGPVKTEVIKPNPVNLEIAKKIKNFTSAVEHHHIKRAIQLLKSSDYAFYIDARIKGEHVLIYAIQSKQIDLAQELITQGANLNCMDLDKKTPLMHAVEIKNTFLAKLIMNTGADTNIKDKNGKTALDYAQANKADEIINLLQKKQG